jgi:virginiamycin A acetyltransferase
MSLHRIDFNAGFAEHLAALGIATGLHGAVDIDERVIVETPVTLGGIDFWQAPAEVGAFSYFGPGCTFANASVGRYCSIGPGVQVGMTRHPADWLTTSPIGYVSDFLNFERHLAADHPGWARALPLQEYDLRPATRIGNDVWIGSRAFIKDGVTIGDGAIIGAHSVVTHDVPPYAIVVGSPAKIIRFRFADTLIERLHRLAWWRCNLLDMPALDLRDAEGCIDELERRIEAGEVGALNTQPIGLVEEHRRFTEIQAFLAQRRA